VIRQIVRRVGFQAVSGSAISRERHPSIEIFKSDQY